MNLEAKIVLASTGLHNIKVSLKWQNNTFFAAQLLGAPQVLRYSVAKEVEAVSGRDVRLEMEVCSDPIPSKTTWDWGSLRVEAGQVSFCNTPPSLELKMKIVGLARALPRWANGSTPRKRGLLHSQTGGEKSQPSRFEALLFTRRKRPWDRQICSRA